MKTRGRARVAALVCAAAGLALWACSSPTDNTQMEFRLPVEVSEVRRGVLEDVVETSGLLRTPAGVTIAIETPGRLQVGRNREGERLREGAVVEAGQVVARVLGEEARLHARVTATKRSLYVAAAELRRQSEDRLVSQQALQQAEGVFQNALHEYRVSSLSAAKATLASPIRGTILHLAREQNGMLLADGQQVGPGFVVAVIAPLDPMIAEVQLIGSELRRVRPGLKARIRHYAFPDAVLKGTVERVLPEVDPYRQTVRARSSLPTKGRFCIPDCSSKWS